MKKPKAVVYVAETACCGLLIHDPSQPGHPAHHRIGVGYESCKVMRYWEFTARRPMTVAEIVKRRG